MCISCHVQTSITCSENKERLEKQRLSVRVSMLCLQCIFYALDRCFLLYTLFFVSAQVCPGNQNNDLGVAMTCCTRWARGTTNHTSQRFFLSWNLVVLFKSSALHLIKNKGSKRVFSQWCQRRTFHWAILKITCFLFVMNIIIMLRTFFCNLYF